MHYLTDTHPLFWSLFSPHRLSPQVLAIFEYAGRGGHTIYVPTIVVTELMLVAERRCTPTRHAEVIETLHALKKAGNYLFLPLLPETAIASCAFTDIPDIFDRLIIAEARRLRASLITYDATITDSGLVDVIWD